MKPRIDEMIHEAGTPPPLNFECIRLRAVRVRASVHFLLAEETYDDAINAWLNLIYIRSSDGSDVKEKQKKTSERENDT
ncbi:hypothetical protein GWI33_011695, partial [Rhynchophorus ferrugineus]